MQFKKLAVALFAAATMISPQAKGKFMGIDELGTTSEFTVTLLRGALNSGDEAFVEQWIAEKGFKFPYNQKGVCQTGLGTSYRDIQYDPKNSSHIADGFMRYNIPLLGSSTCDSLVFADFGWGTEFRSTPSYVSQIPDFLPKKVSPENLKKEAFRQKYLLKYIENLEPNQWDQLPILVVNNSLDFKVRMAAFKKFKELYKNRNSNSTPLQKDLYAQVDKLMKTNESIYNEYYTPQIVLDPYYYMYVMTVMNTLEASEQYVDGYHFSQNKLPIFTKAWMTGEDKKQITLKDVFVDKQVPTHTLESAAAIIFNRDLLKEIKLAAPNLNINKQNSAGNSFFHNFMSLGMKSMHDNIIAANLVRTLLEDGHDFALLNKDKMSPYMLFEQKRGTDATNQARYKFISDAFRLKEYNR